MLAVSQTVSACETWLRGVAAAAGANVPTVFNAIIGIFEKVHPKKNCLWLMGEPNSGKTTMLLYFASIYGKIIRPDGQSEFFWQNMWGKRIYLCDEFEMTNTPEFIAKCKELFAGVPATGITNSITVKRKGPVEITRTPIVLLTNHDVRTRLKSIDADAMKSRICAMKGLKPLSLSNRIMNNMHPYAMKVLTDKYMFPFTDTNKFFAAIDKFIT